MGYAASVTECAVLLRYVLIAATSSLISKHGAFVSNYTALKLGYAVSGSKNAAVKPWYVVSVAENAALLLRNTALVTEHSITIKIMLF